MGTITRPYHYIPDVPIDASEVNADFDTLYTVVNGGLNSANIVNTVTWPASQISIADATGAYSSINVEGALEEAYIKANKPVYNIGYNGIHIIPSITGAVTIFSGTIEINGSMTWNSASFKIEYASIQGGAGAGKNYIFANGGLNNNITASDIFFEKFDAVGNASQIYSHSRAGIYWCAAGAPLGTRRAFAAVYLEDAGSSKISDAVNADPVDATFIKTLTGVEASGVGFVGFDAVGYGTSGTGELVYEVKRIYDRTIGAYGYQAIVKANSATAVAAPGIQGFFNIADSGAASGAISYRVEAEWQYTLSGTTNYNSTPYGACSYPQKQYIITCSACVGIYVATSPCNACDCWFKVSMIPFAKSGATSY